MKWLRNIWWLLTEAPTSLTDASDKVLVCDYCGETDGGITFHHTGDFKICQRCMKKAFDRVLRAS